MKAGDALFKALLGSDEPRAWHIQFHKKDAIIFKPKVDVRIFGVGIYAPTDDDKREFRYKYRWEIQKTANGENISQSEDFEETTMAPRSEDWINGTYFPYIFKNLPKGKDGKEEGILVKAGEYFNFIQQIEYEDHDACFCTRGDNRKVSPDDDFKIYKSDNSKNGTDKEDGIIPSIFYQYA